jgi:hypothetical protein
VGGEGWGDLNLGIRVVLFDVVAVLNKPADQLPWRSRDKLGWVGLVRQQAGEAVDGQPCPQSLLFAVYHVRLSIHLRSARILYQRLPQKEFLPSVCSQIWRIGLTHWV